jgi:hypothetical protein
MVLNFTNEYYVIRKEIPSDMTCGKKDIEFIDRAQR